MISVDDAVARVAGAFRVLPKERVKLEACAGRVLAEDAVARVTQPPAPMSAMDGYAVRAADAHINASLTVIGEAPAGRPFGGTVGPNQTVRIFTGGVVPEGADAVVIQEDTERADNGTVVIKDQPRVDENVRKAGLDFRTGETVLKKGRRISARDVTLLAACDLAEIFVTRRPRVALVATGDELSRPGEPHAPGGIVASSTYGLAAMVHAWGGEALDVGILRDRTEEFASLPDKTKGCDLIVTQGGASVGDHDLVQSALAPHGFALDFWKIAMRPGKPLIFGRLKDTPLLGLPGNPVSAMVCALLFMKPAIAAMLGTDGGHSMTRVKLGAPLKANGGRQDYIRTRIILRDGERYAEPFSLQDSSMQRIFAEADGLIVRPIGAPAAQAGETVEVLSLD